MQRIVTFGNFDQRTIFSGNTLENDHRTAALLLFVILVM
jgi:hypothetical protein